MATYRVAIVGCGARAAAHIESYRYLPNTRVVACCDPNPERREMISTQYNITGYADADEMLRAEGPDIVQLVTWPKTRVELMTLVSEYQIPMCVVEKPIALGVEDWRDLRHIAAVTRTKFAVSHQVRWQEQLKQCEQALRSGWNSITARLKRDAALDRDGEAR